jgi:alkylation response protein AidB-like acyl-CoA dehydrogenase
MNDELVLYRDTVARFVESQMVPHDARWREEHNVGHEIWRKAGELGLLCSDIPSEYGGAGGDFRHEVVLYEELARRALNVSQGGQYRRPLPAPTTVLRSRSGALAFCRAWLSGVASSGRSP